MASEELVKATADVDSRRRAIMMKFRSFATGPSMDEQIASKQSLPPDENSGDQVFRKQATLEPPYPPDFLCTLLEHSSALRQNIEAYAQNIDGFGWLAVPVLDLDADDADDRVRQAIKLERLAERADPANAFNQQVQAQSVNPTDAEVAEKKLRIAEEMLVERARMERFFDFASDDVSFVELRKQMRIDKELMGQGYWEVLRTLGGQLVGFEYVPSFTIRGRKLGEPITVDVRRKVSETKFVTVTRKRRFRLYVQSFENRTVFFKEYGDPRVVSRKNGKVWDEYDTNEENIRAMRTADPEDGPANELIQFKIHSPRSAAYGVPRWIGSLLAVLGNRYAEEVNLLYFENKSIPPMALLVSGGHVTEDTANRLRDFIKSELHGRQNFHNILILEAEPSEHTDGAAAMSIKLQPLTDAQLKDALFLQYDERNMDKIGMAFRLPRMLRGDIRDFNRATAEAALDFAERQVFQPERDEFDFVVNRKILPELGVRWWKFRSKGPQARDPAELVKMIESLEKVGVLTPKEGRQLAEIALGHNLRRIDAPWVNQPLQMTLAGIMVGDTPMDEGEGGVGEALPKESRLKRAMADAARLMQARHTVGAAEMDSAERAYKAAQDAVASDGEAVTIRIPREKMMEFVRPGPKPVAQQEDE